MEISELLKVRKKGENIGVVIPTFHEQTLLDAVKDNSRRRRDVFHPSEICRQDFCPREWVIHQKEPSLYEKRKVNVEQQLRFDIGTLLHTYIQERLGNSGVLFGVWECVRRCKDEKCFNVGFKPKKICKHELWVYREPTVFDEDINVRGSVDGIIVPHKNKKYSLEFKSMKSESFSTLIEPVTQDKHQALWYLDILDRKGFYEWDEFFKDDADELFPTAREIVEMPFFGSVVLYMNKNTQDLREFLVPIEEMPKKSMDLQKKVLKEALSHYQKKILPVRVIQCDSIDSRRAKRCNASKICFNQEG